MSKSFQPSRRFVTRRALRATTDHFKGYPNVVAKGQENSDRQNDTAMTMSNSIPPLTNIPMTNQQLLRLMLREYQRSSDTTKLEGRFLSRVQAWLEVLSECSGVGKLVRTAQYQDELRLILSELGHRNHAEIQRAIQQDTVYISVLMQEVLNSSESKQEALELDAENMERFMALLQFLLERSVARLQGGEGLAQRLLLKLAKASGKLPSTFFISNVKNVNAMMVCGGGFADIFRAQHKGKEVALKKCRVFSSADRQAFHKMLCKEVLVWQALNHPHVLPFLGLDGDTFPGFFCMVSPWMQNGTLIEHIRTRLPLQEDMNRWVFEIAQGTQYLHGRHIVHSDLRGDNILVDDQGGVRIADFGLSRFSDATQTTKTLNGKGTLRWMAPELHFPPDFGLDSSIPTFASDVYAFACTCVEIFSLNAPFSHIRHDAGIFEALKNGHRPSRPIPEGGRVMSDQLWHLVQSCWSEQPSDRPNMQEVTDQSSNASTRTAPMTLQPPKKFIRALHPYRSNSPRALSFEKGDFFHVIQDVDLGGSWYEAHNPMTSAWGLVPRGLFEEFNKNVPPVRASQAGPKTDPTSPIPPGMLSPLKPHKTQVFYAVVLHDFVAERPDELDAKRGDNIAIVAQSNREWLVAKHIGKLGGPGLIPVAFVEVRDSTTNEPVANVEDLTDRGDLPRVEDWKRAMLSYEQNSIALGVIDDPNNRDAAVPNSPYMPQQQHQSASVLSEQASALAGQSGVAGDDTDAPALTLKSSAVLPEGILLSADVVSFHYETDDYWFRIYATYQPYAETGDDLLPPACHLVLFRVYNDFYDFQITLLNTFPREAGLQPPYERILPYMPGPVDHVTQELTSTRRMELEKYMHRLCSLSSFGAFHVVEHVVVREFLMPRPGDVRTAIDPQLDQMEALLGSGAAALREVQEGEEQRIQMQAEQTTAPAVSSAQRHDIGGDFEDEGYSGSPQHSQKKERHPYSGGDAPTAPSHLTLDRRPSADSQSSTHHQERRQHSQPHSNHHKHQRTGSGSSRTRALSPGLGLHRTDSYPDSPLGGRSYSPHSQQAHGDGRASPTTTSTHHAAERRTTRESGGGGNNISSTGGGTLNVGTVNVNSPSISATNLQTAFVKIKIFDPLSNNLIVIRVHPRVSLAELMEKVKVRFGHDTSTLRYCDSVSGVFADFDGDERLRSWIKNRDTDKHVLYVGY